MKRVRYLLGLSSRAECELIESEYFEDDDAFQKMLTAEDDLIDAYARGELTGEERRRFETSSLRGRDRVKFARAFAGAVSVTEARLPNPFALLRTATIAAMIVFIAVLAWLVTDRRKITNELRELRAESVELSKRTEALQRSSDTERTRAADIAAQLTALRAQPAKPRGPERLTTVTQQARHLKNEREKLATIKPKPKQILTSSDSTFANNFERSAIARVPLNSGEVASLLTLNPTIIRRGVIAGNRADQAKVTLDAVLAENLKTGSLIPPSYTISSTETVMRIPSSHSWIRFQIALEAAAIHEEYHLSIRTADGRAATFRYWTEPLTPNQTIIDTPPISTNDLPAGDYVLLLTGKEPDGLFVKVAEYSFRVIRY